MPIPFAQPSIASDPLRNPKQTAAHYHLQNGQRPTRCSPVRKQIQMPTAFPMKSNSTQARTPPRQTKVTCVSFSRTTAFTNYASRAPTARQRATGNHRHRLTFLKSPGLDALQPISEGRVSARTRSRRSDHGDRRSPKRILSTLARIHQEDPHKDADRTDVFA